MAKACLLISVLTLVVYLVYGQEALSGQELKDKPDKFADVAEESIEEGEHSSTDLLLLGSHTSRAKCIQKKKCRNKGGTCQKKKNTCTGKTAKGCAKGCSCCLPDEIICKRSKKCKKGNGTCVKKGQCNGKIIANGCRKPRSCKKTHICCVEGCIGGVIIGDQCMYFSTVKTSWNAAKETCSSQNRRLATINDPQAFKNYAASTYGDSVGFWLGGSDAANEGSWVWINDQPLGNKFPWNHGEPDNWNNNEDCMQYFHHNGMKSYGDAPCYTQRNYVCEKFGTCDTSIGGTAGTSFRVKYLCPSCVTQDKAAIHMNTLGLPVQPPNKYPIFHYLFNTTDYYGHAISYDDVNSGSSNECKIKGVIQTWKCQKKNATKAWTCGGYGSCTANINTNGAGYEPNGDPTCQCPNLNFVTKHVCSTCTSNTDALNFVKNGKKPTNGQPRDVYSGTLTYIPDPPGSNSNICLVNNDALNVKSWRCNPGSSTPWRNCDDIGYCTNIKSERNSGHLLFGDRACYKVHRDMMWDSSCNTRKVIGAGPLKDCMMECKKDFVADKLIGCNAFNYKPGDVCTMKRCLSSNFPKPIPDPNQGFSAYYQDKDIY